MIMNKSLQNNLTTDEIIKYYDIIDLDIYDFADMLDQSYNNGYHTGWVDKEGFNSNLYDYAYKEGFERGHDYYCLDDHYHYEFE